MSMVYIPLAVNRQDKCLEKNVYIPIDGVRDFSAENGIVTRTNEWEWVKETKEEVWTETSLETDRWSYRPTGRLVTNEKKKDYEVTTGYIPAELLRRAMLGDGTEEGQSKARQELWQLCIQHGAL